ncbi:hypothetical protein ABL78_5193 [Leptomonas seymouri]|uniref:Uncharacterized protein n=1 Tax=Leptomonas seymouri TaxID=5684 RepID=A0A0N1I3T2_LEPSE|nr:hypothetical protein ABL78_5193 [Leptomonas seymouri]|eukprot:KPI85744.1 hypothetical protein ABL78_5193 [Leptomonas seymouri]
MRQCTLSCFKASSPLLTAQWCFLSTDDRNLSSSTATRQRDAAPQDTEKAPREHHDLQLTHVNDAVENNDDDMVVCIYRPQVSPEVADRKAKTELFVGLLLTLPRTQDWKDMLSAAFRAGTWRPHHLDAVLRGVQLAKYNEPQEFLRSCGGSPSSLHSNDALREAAWNASQAAPSTSTSTSRLHRARDILVFCAEEGALCAKGGETSEATEEAAANAVSPSSSAAAVTGTAKTSMRSNAFAPSPAAVHRLLTMLLQAAQRGAEYGSPPPSSHPASTSAPPSSSSGGCGLSTASFTEVWHYLSWMELRGYHVLSHAVLDALEAAVDEGGSSPRPQGRRGASSSSAESQTSSSSAASGPSQYASVSQRIHRLDYVRAERALLQKSLRDQPRKSDDPGSSVDRDGVPYKRQHDMPRTDPYL